MCMAKISEAYINAALSSFEQQDFDPDRQECDSISLYATDQAFQAER